MKELLSGLLATAAIDKLQFKPVFFRLNSPEEILAFTHTLEKASFVSDEIYDQLKDLIKCLNPKHKFSAQEYASRIQEHLAGTDIDTYGVWVYYPWSKRMVHMLDEAEFITVRTNRNTYKITPAERELLAKKRIGVIGLSVGQAVSVTAAMERICGEIRLADFDELELSNLNRIRTGVHNLGVKKVVSVAREIAEIDPFLKVTCFEEGLTETNMDAFFLEGGKLDLLIEESDGFDIKILSRHKARALQIPVIMEASDRCMVDVERFDLEPTRGILHGLVDHLDIPTLKSLKTNEEKIPYMLEVLGLETSSVKLRASMLEIEQTITTWPQLASAVAMGGGITTDVSRRMLLNQYTGSGRFHIDIEELIGDKKPQPAQDEQNQQQPPTLDDFAQSISAVSSGDGLALPEATINQIVQAACLAPSGGNVQPWKWIYKNKTLYQFTPFNGTHNYLGYGNLAFYIAQGAAAENVVIKAQETGVDVALQLFPDPTKQDLTATFHFDEPGKLAKAEPNAHTALAKYIASRSTNRNLSERIPVDAAVLASLASKGASIPGISVSFFTSNEDLDRIGDLTGELEKIRLLDEKGHQDFVNEVRWTEQEALQTRDGIDIHTMDITPTELVGLTVARDPVIMANLMQWENSGGAFKKLTRKSIDAASAFGVIYMADDKDASYFQAGRAVQRLWLAAEEAGLAFQPVAASIFMYARLHKGQGAGMSAKACQELQLLWPEYEELFALSPTKVPAFMFRLSKATEAKFRALRKPLTEMFKFVVQ